MRLLVIPKHRTDARYENKKNQAQLCHFILVSLHRFGVVLRQVRCANLMSVRGVPITVAGSPCPPCFV
jgi:hypothetical protein